MKDNLGASPSEAATNEPEETILFMTNGDGTFTCAWCEGIFPVDDAIPDADDEPICPKCHADAQAEDK